MESEQKEALGEYNGTDLFTIVNECGMAIQNVRITHFRSNNSLSEFYIATELKRDERVPGVAFRSVGGLNDNWTVTFALGSGAFMCGKLDKRAGQSIRVSIDHSPGPVRV